METRTDDQQPVERAVRVFISSTFRDMREEREELVKQVFPELRRLCDSRAVVWSEVDLRWGVTDEETAEGKVLPICLAEIHNCRPYFVGIIGERYGWVPEAIDPDLLRAQPWLGEHLRKSVTELEILHGVLNDPAMAEHAFFYFREPAYARGKPAEDFAEASAERRRQLEDLKARIRQAHREGKLKYAPRESYADPKALGELVRKDLSEIIERVFPADRTPDALSREIAEYEAAGRSRLRVYVAREEYYRRLDEHVAGDGPPLVVLGESGAGKTALLANWVARWRAQKREGVRPLLIQHYIGATPSSTDWVAMARRVLGELDRCFELKLEIPDKAEALRMAFANGLYRAAAAGRVVLVLDALNQLEDRDQAPDLPWLPPEVPPNVRLIVSTLPGRSLDELARRQWPTMTVGLLTVEERRELIPRYLRQYGKSLATDQVERLASAEHTKTPLFLRTMLDELRLWGEHETLVRRIDDYLAAKSIPDLFKKVFVRWEEDYGGETYRVSDVLSLLVSARRGLSVHELLQVLGGQDQPLPRAVLAPLLYAAGDVLVDRSGLLNLSHDFARQAVLDTCLSADATRRQFHLRLADHFGKLALGPRKIDELPWQLERAEEWQRLSDLLAEEELFEAAWKANEFEVKAYWASVERSSSLRMVEAYAGVIAGQHGKGIAWRVGLMLGATGHPGEAMAIRQRLAEQYRAAGDLGNLQASLGNQAGILYAWGKLDEAMALHKEQEGICRQLGNLDGLQKSLGNQANILHARGRLDDAMALHREGERICRQLANLDGLQASLNNQALI
ncbi:MAG: DUF4062 domain-containing protein, partial [Deltaproteobacteria bacterium]|nr:DUF4062 domain-containing protein [Deltaproteobacteria bacterium]